MSMIYGGLGLVSTFPKELLLPFSREWELEITIWVQRLLIAPDLPLLASRFCS